MFTCDGESLVRLWLIKALRVKNLKNRQYKTYSKKVTQLNPQVDSRNEKLAVRKKYLHIYIHK